VKRRGGSKGTILQCDSLGTTLRGIRFAIPLPLYLTQEGSVRLLELVSNRTYPAPFSSCFAVNTSPGFPSCLGWILARVAGVVYRYAIAYGIPLMCMWPMDVSDHMRYAPVSL